MRGTGRFLKVQTEALCSKKTSHAENSAQGSLHILRRSLFEGEIEEKVREYKHRYGTKIKRKKNQCRPRITKILYFFAVNNKYYIDNCEERRKAIARESDSSFYGSEPKGNQPWREHASEKKLCRGNELWNMKIEILDGNGGIEQNTTYHPYQR